MYWYGLVLWFCTASFDFGSMLLLISVFEVIITFCLAVCFKSVMSICRFVGARMSDLSHKIKIKSPSHMLMKSSIDYIHRKTNTSSCSNNYYLSKNILFIAFFDKHTPVFLTGDFTNIDYWKLWFEPWFKSQLLVKIYCVIWSWTELGEQCLSNIIITTILKLPESLNCRPARCISVNICSQKLGLSPSLERIVRYGNAKMGGVRWILKNRYGSLRGGRRVCLYIYTLQFVLFDMLYFLDFYHI